VIDALTPEEIALLSLSDETIIKQSEEWCFDQTAYYKRMKSSSERWQRIILTHLHFEHVIDQLLRDAIPFPDEIKLSRMSFQNRLDLARALDLIPAQLTVVTRAISGLRNKLAHRLNFSVEDDRVRDLMGLLPKPLREAVEQEHQPGDGRDEELSRILVATLATLESYRHRWKSERVIRTKRQLKVKEAVINFKALAMTDD